VVSKFHAHFDELFVSLLAVTALERLEPLVATLFGVAPSPQNHGEVAVKQLLPVIFHLEVAKIVLDRGGWPKVVHDVCCIEACCAVRELEVLDLIVRSMQLSKSFFTHAHPKCRRAILAVHGHIMFAWQIVIEDDIATDTVVTESEAVDTLLRSFKLHALLDFFWALLVDAARS
jgi:hypothetical protein